MTERKGKHNVTTEAEVGVMWPQAQDAGSQQKEGTDSLLASGGSTTLPTHSFRPVKVISNFQSPEL